MKGPAPPRPGVEHWIRYVAPAYARKFLAELVSVSPEDHEKRDTKTPHQGSSVHQSVTPPEG